MPAKTFNLSMAALSYLESLPAKNLSAALDNLILEHRGLSPTIKKQKALGLLRQAALELAQDHDIAQEAIVSYVIEATGGE